MGQEFSYRALRRIGVYRRSKRTEATEGRSRYHLQKGAGRWIQVDGLLLVGGVACGLPGLDDDLAGLIVALEGGGQTLPCRPDSCRTLSSCVSSWMRSEIRE